MGLRGVVRMGRVRVRMQVLRTRQRLWVVVLGAVRVCQTQGCLIGGSYRMGI
jgi:hypothetical protein